MDKGKLFLLGFVSACAIAAAGYFIDEQLCQKESFKTKHGQSVHEMCVKRKTGFTLPKSEVDRAEEAFLQFCEQVGFKQEEVKKFFKNNKILYYPSPMPSPDPRLKAEYVFAYYSSRDNGIRLGIWPKAKNTALCHEWIHDVLRQKTGNSDANHEGPWWVLETMCLDELRK